MAFDGRSTADDVLAGIDLSEISRGSCLRSSPVHEVGRPGCGHQRLLRHGAGGRRERRGVLRGLCAQEAEPGSSGPCRCQAPVGRHPGADRCGLNASRTSRTQQFVVTVPRRIENRRVRCRARPVPGATREHTGSIRPRSSAARRDAASFECSGTFTTGC